MDDNIDQKNRMVEDHIEGSKTYEERSSKKGIKKMKWKVYLSFFVVCGVSFPLINSVMTKLRLEREEK